MLADGVVEGRGRGPTDTVAAENFECEISSDNYDISVQILGILFPEPPLSHLRNKNK
jgi:hypothetical protein